MIAILSLCSLEEVAVWASELLVLSVTRLAVTSCILAITSGENVLDTTVLNSELYVISCHNLDALPGLGV